MIELPSLIGEEISAVSFVRNYVEFLFDGPILRSLSNPSVWSEGIEYKFPDAGSRDALCRLIGAKVVYVDLEEDHALNIVTSNDCRLLIPLAVDHLCGGEAMHFVPEGEGSLQVW